MLKKIAQFAVVIAAVFALQLVGAGIITLIVVPAGRWLEYFAAHDMEEVAVIGAMVIGIGGFVAVLIGINRAQDWWRMRRIARRA